MKRNPKSNFFKSLTLLLVTGSLFSCVNSNKISDKSKTLTQKPTLPLAEKIYWPQGVPQETKKATFEDPRLKEKMAAIEQMRKTYASEVRLPYSKGQREAESYRKNLLPDGSFADLTREKVMARHRARKSLTVEYQCSDFMVENASNRLSTLVKLWAFGSYKKDPELKKLLYKSFVYYMDFEVSRNDYRWCASAMVAPKACCDGYFCFFNDMEAVEKGQLTDPLIIRANTLFKQVASQSFSQQPRKDAPNPLSVERFRKHPNWVGGNFGYRPLLDTALVCRNPKMLDVIAAVCHGALSITSWNTRKTAFWEEGMTADGSGWGHGTQGYVWGYPMSGVLAVIKHLNRLKGTPWEGQKLDLNRLKLISNYVEGNLWYIYKPDGYTLMAPGRISMRCGSFNNSKAACSLAKRTLTLLPETEMDERAKLQRCIDIFDDKENEIYGNRYFWNNDDMIQRCKDYYVGINMTSARTSSTEVVNSSSSHTEYLGDGATFLMKRPEAFNHAKGFWTYTAIPGTTTRQGKLKADYAVWRGFQGVHNFAGGVSDGKIGVCSFIYEKKFSPLPKNPSLFGVVAHKAYFLFENDLICLGIGIVNKNPELDEEIWTCVNQAQLRGKVTYSCDGGQTIENLQLGARKLANTDKPILLAHDGLGYIILPEQTNGQVTTLVEKRQSRWMDIYPDANRKIKNKPGTMNMVQLHINHGKNPTHTKTDSYGYIIHLRCPHFLSLKKYYKTMPLKILSNTNELQAVYNDDKKIIQAIFYSSNAVLALGKTLYKVNAPIILMIKEHKSGELTFFVADPLQNTDLKKLVIFTNQRLIGTGAKQANGGTKISVTMPTDPYCGKQEQRTYRTVNE